MLLQLGRIPGEISPNGFDIAIILSIYFVRTEVIFARWWALGLERHPSQDKDELKTRRLVFIFGALSWPWDALKSFIRIIFN